MRPFFASINAYLKQGMRWTILSLGCLLGGLTPALMPTAVYAVNDATEVMQAFNKPEKPSEARATEKERHQILFIMGVLLLAAVLAAAGFGVAMAVFGKKVFVPHMIFAGITVFLSIAHAVTAIVWFYPF